MSRPLQAALRVLDGALGFAFQPQCLLCPRSAKIGPLCETCVWRAPLTAPLCDHCGIGLPQAMAACGRCLKLRGSAILRARSELWLTEEARKILHYVKYAGAFEFMDLFRASIFSCEELPFPRDCEVMAVPLHLRRFQERSFNQSTLLAKWMSQAHGFPLASLAFRKQRATVAQSLLTRAARLRNLQGSFAWAGKQAPPARILLIDDVFTTGSTLQTCARVLRRAGAKEIYAWTLFRTVPVGTITAR